MAKFFRFVRAMFVASMAKCRDNVNKLPHRRQRILAVLCGIVEYPIVFIAVIIWLLVASRGECLDITEEDIMQAYMETE